MNQLRSRIEKIEDALGRADADNDRARSEMFVGQLHDLTDAELDRLEAITLRAIEVGGTDGCMLAPEGYEHIRDVIAFVDANEDAYFAAIAEGSR